MQQQALGLQQWETDGQRLRQRAGLGVTPGNRWAPVFCKVGPRGGGAGWMDPLPEAGFSLFWGGAKRQKNFLTPKVCPPVPLEWVPYPLVLKKDGWWLGDSGGDSPCPPTSIWPWGELTLSPPHPGLPTQPWPQLQGLEAVAAEQRAAQRRREADLRAAESALKQRQAAFEASASSNARLPQKQ